MLFRYTLFALGRDMVYAPVWWYTGGVVFMYSWLVRRVTNVWHMLGIGMWMRHIFTPMFQQYDWQGRLISFFMRVVQIIVRCIAFIFLMVLLICVFLLWIIAPIVLSVILIQEIA